jgi:hypothetical protein
MRDHENTQTKIWLSLQSNHHHRPINIVTNHDIDSVEGQHSRARKDVVSERPSRRQRRIIGTCWLNPKVQL